MGPSLSGPGLGPGIVRCCYIDVERNVECVGEATPGLPLCHQHLTMNEHKFPARPSPPTKKPAPFQTTAARLLPDPEPGSVLSRTMRKTVGPPRIATTKTASSTKSTRPPDHGNHIYSPPESPRGPERKRRRLENGISANPVLGFPNHGHEAADRPNGVAWARRENLPDGAGKLAGGVDPSLCSSPAAISAGRPSILDAVPDMGLHGGNTGAFMSAAAQHASGAGDGSRFWNGRATETLPLDHDASADTNGHHSAGEDAGKSCLPGTQAPPSSYNPGLTRWFMEAWSKDTTKPHPGQQAPRISGLSFGEARPEATPLVEQFRLQLVAKYEATQYAFDSLIYSQQAAKQPPPRGVRLTGKLSNSGPRDAPFFDYIDPRVHWVRPISETWLAQKQAEIKSRGGRKANFGQAARSQAERRAKEKESASSRHPKPPGSATPENEQRGEDDRNAALARLRKDLETWDQESWERDKKATQTEGTQEKLKKKSRQVQNR